MDGDFIGRGEAAPSKRYGESSKLILSVLENGIQVPENYQSREHLWGFLKPQLRKIASLEAAVNMAVWDLSTQKQNIPLYKSFGFENITLPKTSYTISIGKLNVFIGCKFNSIFFKPIVLYFISSFSDSLLNNDILELY